MARYAALETVTLVPCWSTPKMRFCQSELKTAIIAAELRRRWPGRAVVNVTGVRRDESVQRSKGSVSSLEKGLLSWRPISNWTLPQVLESIAGNGLELHPAYSVHGMSRVSCIMASLPDLRAAAAARETRETYCRMVQLEATSTFAFHGSRWLADIRPDILPLALRKAILHAKAKADQRRAIEAEISPGMLYVKGWSTRIRTDEEADVLASVRQRMAVLYGFEVAHTTRTEIQARYGFLMAERARKETAKKRRAA